jgi:hypothetical protein
MITEKLELVKGLLEGVSLWKGPVENVGLWNDYWQAWACERTSGMCEPVKESYGLKAWTSERTSLRVSLWKGLVEDVSLW